MKYFVSYTTIDKEITKEFLYQFSNELKKYGEAFIDMLDNNSSDKQLRIIYEIDSSDMLILIDTKSIYQSKWVLLEIERARGKEKPIQKISVNDILNNNFQHIIK
ncbi:MAG: toll/interleukin-1 receptor domain-containing protein [Planctomycetaceae bacterium]|jgi:hypothetical protein|nr:toll/interleukin-1 receptor domain-containing protein [Planctomycetaceae bacterium]